MPLLYPSHVATPVRLKTALGLAALAVALQVSAASPADAAATASPGAVVSSVAERFAQDVVRTSDAGGRTFGIIDKPSATLWVFDAQGRALASTPVLVGEATGDVAPADIGTRPLSRVKKH